MAIVIVTLCAVPLGCQSQNTVTQPIPVYWNAQTYKGEGLYILGFGRLGKGDGARVGFTDPTSTCTLTFGVYNGTKMDIFLLTGEDARVNDPYVAWDEYRIVGGEVESAGVRQAIVPPFDSVASTFRFLPRSDMEVGDRMNLPLRKVYMTHCDIDLSRRWKWEEANLEFCRPLRFFVRGDGQLHEVLARRLLVLTFCSPGNSGELKELKGDAPVTDGGIKGIKGTEH